MPLQAIIEIRKLMAQQKAFIPSVQDISRKHCISVVAVRLYLKATSSDLLGVSRYALGSGPENQLRQIFADLCALLSVVVETI